MTTVKARLHLSVVVALSLLTTLALKSDCIGARIKDIGFFMGSRPNMLFGYGLVVGLNGTGDKEKTEFTVNTLANLLDNLGIHVNPDDVKVKNVAAVMVTAKLPPFARVGTKLDAQVSSIGDAKSIVGGTLLMTPLQGPDGKVYAVAQGPISVGGFAFGGAAGGGVQQNHPTVGYIPNGAVVEREIPIDMSQYSVLDFVLRSPDFTTANHVAEAINAHFGSKIAFPRDASTIRVHTPTEKKQDIVGFIAEVENLEVVPDTPARVVINERTGTIVMGENVRISPVAVAHGNLTVSITEQPYVSQPLPFSQGQTTVVPRTQVQVEEEKAHLAIVGGGVTIGQVVEGLNAIGATPRDLINILQAIKAAGALHADLEIM